jgi:hypothetical protein
VAVALIAGGLVLDQIASGQQVPGSGHLWLYPFLLGAGRRWGARRGATASYPIGWILLLGALLLAAVLAAMPYAWVALEAHPGSLPGGSWAALVSSFWPAFFAWPLHSAPACKERPRRHAAPQRQRSRTPAAELVELRAVEAPAS